MEAEAERGPDVGGTSNKRVGSRSGRVRGASRRRGGNRRRPREAALGAQRKKQQQHQVS